MANYDLNNADSIIKRLRHQAETELFRITAHGHQEMVEEDILLDEVIHAISNGTVVENYPAHQRGACCLVSGPGGLGRDLHVVCTTSNDKIIVITVYQPKPPKWITPFQRGQRDEM